MGYTKIYDSDKTPYIITLHIDEYKPVTGIIFNSNCATYKTNIFTIIRIETIDGQDVNKINKYEIDKSYVQDILFWFDHNIAFNYKFIENKEYLLFENGYSGIYKEYMTDGQLKKEFYHTNGLISGEYRLYEFNNTFVQCFYIDGRLHGITKRYFNNILKYECIYDDDKIVGEEKTYYYSGEIKEIKNHDNNITIKYWKNSKIRKSYFKHERDYCPRYFCTCEDRQLNPHSKWLILELTERNYSRFNEFMCNIIKLFTHQETEEEIKKNNKKRRDKTDELRKKYG